MNGNIESLSLVVIIYALFQYKVAFYMILHVRQWPCITKPFKFILSACASICPSSQAGTGLKDSALHTRSFVDFLIKRRSQLVDLVAEILRYIERKHQNQPGDTICISWRIRRGTYTILLHLTDLIESWKTMHITFLHLIIQILIKHMKNPTMPRSKVQWNRILSRSNKTKPAEQAIQVVKIWSNDYK